MPSNREIVGWTDPEEWEHVFNNIFSGDNERIQHGLDVINVWKCRYAGRMPVAIEATAQVIGCKLLGEHCSDLNKRQTMATAISQFIGLLTERALKGQIHSIPMRVRGEEFGIPQWVTSIRHDVAHGLIPALSLLEKGVNFALQWLKTNHWDEHQKWNHRKCDNPSEVTNDPELIESLLNFIFTNSKKASSMKLPPLTELTPLIKTLLQYNIISIPTYVASSMRHSEKDALCNSVMKQFERILKLLQDSDQLGMLLTGIQNETKYAYMTKIAVDKLLASVSEISNGTCSNVPATAASPSDVEIDHNENLRPIPNTNNPAATESWSLCDYDLSDCCLGLMPGQNKHTLWKDLHGGAFLGATDVEPSHYFNGQRTIQTEVNLRHCDFDLL